MSLDLHTVALVEGTQLTNQDKILFGQKLAVANAAGATGATVTTAVTFAGQLPASYFVDVCPSQDVTWYVTGKTNAGFNVVMNPRLAANAIAAGTFDVRVTA